MLTRPINHSTDQFLSAHVGSLPPPPEPLEMLAASQRGEAVGAAACGRQVREAVAEVVRRQLELGLDVIADGEMSKPSFLTYASERLGGSEPEPEPADSPSPGS